MKKWIAMILGALLLISAAACAQKTDGQNTAETPAPEQNADAELTGTEETNEEPPVGTLAGGWQVAENNEMTEERKAVFEKGLEGLVGVDYVPIAYLGSQVVAGTNHCILAEGKVVYPNSTPMYVLVFLYEDLSGNVSLMNIENLPIIAEDDGTLSAPGGEMLMGGWAYADSYEVTDEMRDRLNKALWKQSRVPRKRSRRSRKRSALRTNRSPTSAPRSSRDSTAACSARSRPSF